MFSFRTTYPVFTFVKCFPCQNLGNRPGRKVHLPDESLLLWQCRRTLYKQGGFLPPPPTFLENPKTPLNSRKHECQRRLYFFSESPIVHMNNSVNPCSSSTLKYYKTVYCVRRGRVQGLQRCGWLDVYHPSLCIQYSFVGRVANDNSDDSHICSLTVTRNELA